MRSLFDRKAFLNFIFPLVFAIFIYFLFTFDWGVGFVGELSFVVNFIPCLIAAMTGAGSHGFNETAFFAVVVIQWFLIGLILSRFIRKALLKT